MTDFLKKTLKEIEARKRELEPAIAEYRQLEEAAAALEGVEGGTASSTRPRRPARSRRTSTRRRGATATKRSAPTRGRGRPRGSGKRAQQALKLVKGQPGITIPELAKKMKIQPNYLYRVLPALERDGKVKRKDKGWHPA